MRATFFEIAAERGRRTIDRALSGPDLSSTGA